MEFREFSGKTVDDAIIEAATTLGIASSELDIEIVNKGSSGFLGLGSKPAIIKAKAKKEVKDEIDDILAAAKKPGKSPKKAAAPKKEAPAKAPVKKETPDFDKPVNEIDKSPSVHEVLDYEIDEECDYRYDYTNQQSEYGLVEAFYHVWSCFHIINSNSLINLYSVKSARTGTIAA